MEKIKHENETERKRLIVAGIGETTVAEFLGLTPEEDAQIEMMVALTRELRKAQPEGEVIRESFDELIADLLAAGYTPAQIGNCLAKTPFNKPRHKSATKSQKEEEMAYA